MDEEKLALRLGKLILKRSDLNREMIQAWVHSRWHLQNHLSACIDLADLEISLIRESFKQKRRQ